ncbi:DciA family protein [Hyphococcus sp.]|uniref:DciA family protein n=1 Tax=Hyphococcus sp. TaxID=2038636 RepID=UPI0035C73E8C
MTIYQRTRPIRSAAPAIARASAGVFRKLAQQTKFMDPALAERWPQLAGEKLAALCRPGRLTGRGPGGGGRTLELFVPNGAAAAAVDMERDGLIARLNTYLGPGSVSRIAVIQTGKAVTASKGPAPEGGGEDGELGAALASFRTAIRRRNGGK